jgi:hypothetical protein
MSPQVSVLLTTKLLALALAQSALQRLGGPLTQDRGSESVGTNNSPSSSAPASALGTNDLFVVFALIVVVFFVGRGATQLLENGILMILIPATDAL